jgi:hypothetical protein
MVRTHCDRQASQVVLSQPSGTLSRVIAHRPQGDLFQWDDRARLTPEKHVWITKGLPSQKTKW